MACEALPETVFQSIGEDFLLRSAAAWRERGGQRGYECRAEEKRVFSRQRFFVSVSLIGGP
jgi:hypothetical protein